MNFLDIFKHKKRDNEDKDTLGLHALHRAVQRLLNEYDKLKEENNELRKNIDDVSLGKRISVSNSSYDLNKKVDEFIIWYFNNMVKGKYTDLGENNMPFDMRNLIEKYAVWYELRYPDYMLYLNDRNDVNNGMFRNNQFINDNFDENDLINYMDWGEFYNTHSFIKNLPWEDKYLLYVSYPSSIEINGIILFLTKKGIVKEVQGFDNIFIGMHINNALDILKNNGINITKAMEQIKEYDNRVKLKEEFLNCVMYRIIERGGNRIGARRGLVFAKEFNRNIDIPMIYGIDYTDPYLKELINDYLMSGGHLDLECLEGYFSKSAYKNEIKTVILSDVLKYERDKITYEERELYQRLVNSLSTQVDYNLVTKHEIEQKRLNRKLKK